MWLAGFSAEFLLSQSKLNKKIRLRGLAESLLGYAALLDCTAQNGME